MRPTLFVFVLCVTLSTVYTFSDDRIKQSPWIHQQKGNSKCVDGVPGPVRNLKQSEATEDSITVTWDPPEDPSCLKEYRIEVVDVITLSAGQGTYITVSNLKPCTSYTVNVFAVSKTDESSAPETIKTTGAPPRPAGVTVKDVTETSGTVLWQSPDYGDCITGYKILDSEGTEIYSTVDTMIYTADNLKPCNVYSWSVISLFDQIESIAEPAEIKTLPKGLTGLTQTEATDDSATLAWDASECDVKEYIISYEGTSISTTTTGVILEGLGSCANIEAEVVMVTTAGLSTDPEGIVIRTTSTAVKEVTTDEVKETEATISWVPPDSSSCVTGYRIKNKNGDEVVTTDSNTLSSTINQLSGCTAYEFNVVTLNENFESAPVGTSLDTIPGAISDLKVAELTDKHAKITWNPPQPDTCISEYRVKVDGNQFTTTETEFVVKDLQGCSSYKITVAAFGNSHESDSQTTTIIDTPPGQITNFEVSDITNSEAVVTWSAPKPDKCISGYKIEKDGEELAVITETTYTITGLTSCAFYEIAVTAIGDGYEGERFTETIGADPGTVVDLHQTGSDLNSISIAWEAPAHPECIGSYIVSYNGEVLAEIPFAETAYKITELNPCTKGKVSVAAISDEGNSGDVLELDVSTSSVTTIGRVKNLEQIGTELESVTISWEPPEYESCVVEYFIFFNSARYAEVDPTHLTFELGNLDQCTEGYAGVAAVIANGINGEVTEIPIETLIVPECVLPGEVLNLMQNVTTETEVTITWDPPEDSSKVFEYSVLEEAGEHRIPETQLQYTLTNLLACTRYRVAVAAVSDEEEYGPYKNITPQTSKPDQILAVENYKGKVENDGIILTWQPPASHISCVTAYRIVIWSHNEAIIPTEIFDQNNNILNFTITPLAGCRVYNAGVKAMMGVSESNIVIFNFTAPPKVMDPPTCSRVTSNSNSASLTCKTQAFKDNACDLTMLTMTCSPSSGGADIVSTLSIVDNYLRPSLRVNVEGLNPDTTYSCKAVLTNIAGNSEASSPVEINTFKYNGNEINHVRKKRNTNSLQNMSKSDIDTCYSPVRKRKINRRPRAGCDHLTSILIVSQDFEKTTENSIPISMNNSEACPVNYHIYNIDCILIASPPGDQYDFTTTACQDITLQIEMFLDDIPGARVQHQFKSASSKVTFVAQTEAIDDTATISWVKPSGTCLVDGYRIDGDDKNIVTETESYTFTNVAPCHTFETTVEAFRKDPYGGSERIYSEPTHVTITTAPGQVSNLVRKSTDTTEITVTWDPQDCADSYDAIISVDGDDQPMKITGTEATYTDLTPCSVYPIKVAALKGEYRGKYLEKNFSTSGTPEAVQNLRQVASTSNSVTIQWDPSESSCINRIEVIYNGKKEEAKGDSHTLNDITSCDGEVEVLVVAIGLNGEGIPTSIPVSTLGKVETLIVEQLSDSASISWEEAECASSYILSYKPTSTDDPYKEIKVDDPKHTLTDLKPCTSYSVKVKALDNVGNSGVESEQQDFSTAVLTSEITITQSGQTDSSVFVEWNLENSLSETCIKEYELKLSSDPDNLIPVDATESSTELTLSKCSDEVTITAIFEGDEKIVSDPLTVYREINPAPVTDLHSTGSTPDSVTISWAEITDKSCVKRVDVRYDRNIEEATENSHTITGVRLCGREMLVNVVVVYMNSQESKATPLGVTTAIGKVENLEVKAVTDSAIVSWDDSVCAASYNINFDGTPHLIEGTTYTIKNLNPCTDYEVTVEVLNTTGQSGGEVRKSFSTVVMNPIISIWQKDQTNASVTVEWKLENPKSLNCIQEYILTSSLDPEGSVVTKDKNSAELEIIKCTDTVTITAKLMNIPKSTNSVQVYTSQPVEGIELISQSIDYGIIMWTMKDTTCNYTYEVYVNDELVKEIDETRFKVDTPEPCTDYVVEVVVKNNNTTSLPTPKTITSPSQGIPNPPVIVIDHTTSSGFSISWPDPDGECPFIVSNYTVHVKPLGPMHFIPSDCHPVEEVPWDDTIDSKTKTYSFENGTENYGYGVSVIANTETSSSDPGYINVTLQNGDPEPPRDVQYSFIGSVDENNKIDTRVTLKYPCKPNGVIKTFNISGESQQNPSDHFEIIINAEPGSNNYSFLLNLTAYSNYSYSLASCVDENCEFSEEDYIITPGGYPGEPQHIVIKDETLTGFTVEWEDPEQTNGDLIGYEIVIVGKPNFPYPEQCVLESINRTARLQKVNSYRFKDGRPSYTFDVDLYAKTSAGLGKPISATAKTNIPIPEPAKGVTIEFNFDESTEEYKADVEISFKRPCEGPIDEYIFRKIVIEPNGNSVETIHPLKEPHFKFANITKKSKYIIGIELVYQNLKSNETRSEFEAPGGVPEDPVKEEISVSSQEPNTAIFTLKKNIFNDLNGDIKYYAIISGSMQNSQDFGYWDGNVWPPVENTSSRGIDKAHYITEKFWNPFSGAASEYKFVIGSNTSCTIGEDFCNGPLTPETEYVFIVRGFTSHGYKDSQPISVRTIAEVIEAAADIGMILGIIFGILGVAIIVGSLYFLWRRRQNSNNKQKHTDIPMTYMRVPIKQYPIYYRDVKDNSNKLKTEYNVIQTKSTEEAPSSYNAILPKNKKKNRYANILPYDHTRVILEDKGDDYSDYINASYITGFSGNVEYIASQGPLPTTCLDFWKMVMQEKVHIIVMVAQFVENNKDKCFKYFPRNHENMEVGDEIEIRCMNELDFGWYCIRTIQLQNGLSKQTITHLQFMDWPDFDCPVGTNNMLEFVRIMRQHIYRGANRPALVHCSAGVGRTGTLIALDIILQAINDKRDIDVFGTVMALRRQRPRMVQTEKQYLYIHDCIYDFLMNPNPVDEYNRNNDPIYANVNGIKQP